MTEEFALGIDLGTTAVKVGLFDAGRGVPLALSAQEYRLSTPAPGWVELDPSIYWERTVAGVREVSGKLPSGGRIVSVGLSSQGQTFAMLDHGGEPVRPAIVWIDSRATAELAEFAAAVGGERFYRATGSPFPNTVDSAPKILWVRRNEPDVFARVAHVLVLPAYIAYRLTGRMVADSGDAASTSLYDAEAGGWWPEAVAAVGLEPAMLGRVAEGGTLIGGIDATAADELGLLAGLPVGAGANDQTCAAIAMGNRAPGTLTGTVGTALAVLGTAPAAAPHPGGGVLVTRNPIGGHRLLLAYTKTAAIMLTWFRDKVVTGRSYEELLSEAAQVPAGCEGLTALPHLSGMATPSFDDAVRGGFVGLSIQHGRRHMTRAIVESVCFGARDCIGLIRDAGVEGDAFIVSGGATRSSVWMQALADVLGMRVRVPDCPEAACRGGALLGLLAAGRQEALDWPAGTGQASASYVPDPAVRPAYEAAYERYGRAMDALYPGARMRPR